MSEDFLLKHGRHCSHLVDTTNIFCCVTKSNFTSLMKF